MQKHFNILIIYSSLLLLLIPTSISANENLSCTNIIPLESKLTFDNEEHRLWYRTFWNGNCKGLGFFKCRPGNSWNKGIVEIEFSHKGDNRQFLHSELCKLGQTIGYEWARDNNIRCINTEDLRIYQKIFKRKDDVFNRIDLIKNEANEKIRNCHRR
jgi:hypothetical protein